MQGQYLGAGRIWFLKQFAQFLYTSVLVSLL